MDDSSHTLLYGGQPLLIGGNGVSEPPHMDLEHFYEVRVNTIFATAKQKIGALVAEADANARQDVAQLELVIDTWQALVTAPEYLSKVTRVDGPTIYADLQLLQGKLHELRLGGAMEIWHSWPQAVLDSRKPNTKKFRGPPPPARYNEGGFCSAINRTARNAWRKIEQLVAAAEKRVGESEKRLLHFARNWREDMLDYRHKLFFARNPTLVGARLESFEKGLATMNLSWHNVWPVSTLLDGTSTLLKSMREADPPAHDARDRSASTRHGIPLDRSSRLPVDFPASSALDIPYQDGGSGGKGSSLGTGAFGFAPHSQLGQVAPAPQALDMAASAWPDAAFNTHSEVYPAQHHDGSRMGMPIDQPYLYGNSYSVAPEAWFGNHVAGFGAAPAVWSAGDNAYAHSGASHAPTLVGNAHPFALSPVSHSQDPTSAQPNTVFQPTARAGGRSQDGPPFRLPVAEVSLSAVDCVVFDSAATAAIPPRCFTAAMPTTRRSKKLASRQNAAATAAPPQVASVSFASSATAPTASREALLDAYATKVHAVVSHAHDRVDTLVQQAIHRDQRRLQEAEAAAAHWRTEVSTPDFQACLRHAILSVLSENLDCLFLQARQLSSLEDRLQWASGPPSHALPHPHKLTPSSYAIAG
ncbi:hypothetical protein JCM10908_006615 [Rhodotorula pacifica]|uniref:uncharacterized protein n=1 Tax=Rhodotorula pacifica TaxID=1495444 RepID=UPI00317D2C92